MFASFVPEIVDIVGRRERYGGTYDKPVGVRQVIHFTLLSVFKYLELRSSTQRFGIAVSFS